MALRLRHWLIAALGMCGVLAAIRLPPDPESRIVRFSGVGPTPERRRADRIGHLISASENNLRILREFERLRTLVAATPAGELILDVPREEPRRIDGSTPTVTLRPLTLVADVSRAARAAYDSLASPRQATVGITIGQDRGQNSGVEYFVFSVDDRTACIARYDGIFNELLRDKDVSNAAHDGLRHGSAPSPLGACEVYSRHGMPGRQIQAWLDRGGMQVIQPYWAFATPTPTSVPRPRFWTLFRPYWWFDSGVQRCVAGDRVSCSIAFQAQTSRAWVPGHATVFWWSGLWNDFMRLGGEAFIGLEGEFGSAAFNQFWVSDHRMEEAFNAAFGIELGEWVYGWAIDAFGKRPRGPRMPFRSYVWILFFLALATGWTTLRARLRQIK